jgi:hypothetical protein
MSATELVQRLTALASEQRVAAISFDVERLDELTRQRADTLFELQVELQRDLSPGERSELRALVPAYQRAESRLARVLGTVNAALRPLGNPRAPTYGPAGQLMGG